MNECEDIIVNYDGGELKLTWSDLWFIKQIREIKFGKLSEVEVQDGKIVMIKQMEKKLKPQRLEAIKE